MICPDPDIYSDWGSHLSDQKKESKASTKKH